MFFLNNALKKKNLKNITCYREKDLSGKIYTELKAGRDTSKFPPDESISSSFPTLQQSSFLCLFVKKFGGGYVLNIAESPSLTSKPLSYLGAQQGDVRILWFQA